MIINKHKQPLPEVNSESLLWILENSKVCGNKTKPFQYDSSWRIYYTIGEWNDKNNIDGSIKTFCKAFTDRDKVKLIVKTFHTDYSKKSIDYCIDSFEKVIKEFDNPPEVLLITKSMSRSETMTLHSIGDCFFSMTRDGGFTEGVFDAFNYGKEMIITGYGEHVDYLGKDYRGLIDYKTVNIPLKNGPRA